MTSPIIRSAPSTRPALELIALAKLSPDVARRNLRVTLAANPDHFGRLTEVAFKTILKIENETTYERIAGLGYNPESRRIQSIITARQQNGYSGGGRNPTSIEYVRFYLSYDGGNVWHDQGMRAFYVCDTPETRPREHAVTLQIRPREDLSSPQVPQRVRAILSWNAPPPSCDPHWSPVWGDIAEAEIRIERKTLHHFEPADVNAHAAAGIVSADGERSKMLSPGDLRGLYRSSGVPEHRYLSPLLASMKAASGQENLRASDWEDLRSTTLFDGISDIDLRTLVPKWLNTVEDTTYEQLGCVGFDASSKDLVAVIRIKAGSGYAGGPRAFGSTEFVAFWIDGGERWEYAGTAFLRVHDTGLDVKGGLQYSVFLPLQPVWLARLAVGPSRTVKLRAVLSWNTPPSARSAYEPVVWGETLDGFIEIQDHHAIRETPPAEIPMLTAARQ